MPQYSIHILDWSPCSFWLKLSPVKEQRITKILTALVIFKGFCAFPCGQVLPIMVTFISKKTFYCNSSIYGGQWNLWMVTTPEYHTTLWFLSISYTTSESERPFFSLSFVMLEDHCKNPATMFKSCFFFTMRRLRDLKPSWKLTEMTIPATHVIIRTLFRYTSGISLWEYNKFLLCLNWCLLQGGRKCTFEQQQEWCLRQGLSNWHKEGQAGTAAKVEGMSNDLQEHALLKGWVGI